MLVRRYGRFVRGSIEAVVRDYDDVDDVLQIVWLKLWQRLSAESLAPRSAAAWLKCVARRACRDWNRGCARRQRNEWLASCDPWGDGGSSTARERWLASAYLQRRVDVAYNALARLRGVKRVVAILHFTMGKSASEIGNLLGCTARSASTALWRIRHHFREQAENLTNEVEDTYVRMAQQPPLVGHVSPTREPSGVGRQPRPAAC